MRARCDLVIGKLEQFPPDARGSDAVAEAAGGPVNGGDRKRVILRPSAKVGSLLQEAGSKLRVIRLYFCGHAELI